MSRSGSRWTRLNRTWLDSTGPWSARSASCHCFSEKLLTPMCPTSPDSTSRFMRGMVAPTGNSGLGQCCWYRSMWSTPRRRALARIPDRLAHDALGPALAVDLGGVDEVDAELERAMDDRLRVLARVAAAVAPLHRAELPRAEADGGDAHATRLDELHRSLADRHPLPLGAQMKRE